MLFDERRHLGLARIKDRLSFGVQASRSAFIWLALESRTDRAENEDASGNSEAGFQPARTVGQDADEYWPNALPDADRDGQPSNCRRPDVRRRDLACYGTHRSDDGQECTAEQGG